MSKKVQNFHLSAECRYILYRLRNEINSQLNRDIFYGFPCKTRSLGSLLPLIYQAFIKIWCSKDRSLTVKKSSYSTVGLDDCSKILIDYDLYMSFYDDSHAYHELLHQLSDSSDLPF